MPFRSRGWALGSSEAPCLLHTGSAYAPLTQQFLDLIESGKDEFVTELYAAQLEAVLAGWSEWLTGRAVGAGSLGDLGGSLAATVYATRMDEAVLTPLRTGAPLATSRAVFAAPGELPPAGFVEGLEKYLAPLGTIVAASLRISGIEIASESPLRLRTELTYLLAGRTDASKAEQRTGAWQIDWLHDDGGAWAITGWACGPERRSELHGPGFVEITAASFAGVASLGEQLDHGVDYWRTVLDGAYGVDIYGNNGISVGDYDGDGRDDIYVCQPTGLPNRLFRNRGDGTFEDVTEAAGVGVLDPTSSAIFADFRNTGRQDLLVVRTVGPLLFLNRGDGTFHLEENAFHCEKPPQGSFTSVAVADYNLDGFLDIYFCLYSYYQGLSDYQFPRPYYDAQNGPPNFLFRNRGDGTFEDVTAASGMNVHNDRYTLACSWNDYNQDGYSDLYVVNDFGRKILYRNNANGTFTDVSVEAGVEDAGEGMSSTWFDYDNDGHDDLYAVNMWEAAGKRVTAQKQFMPGVAEEIRKVYRQDARGNTLLHAEGAKFRDVSDDTGTRVSGWNWSSSAWDLDQDGFQDLYVVNGFISGQSSRDVSSFYWRQVAARSMEMGGRSKMYEEAWSTINEAIRSDYTWSGRQRNNLFVNNREGSFTESGSVLGLDCLEDGRAFALVDLDGDGRLEVLVKNRSSPQLRVFHNQLMLAGGSVSISLRGTKCNRDAISAVVELKTAAGVQRQVVAAGSGFLSQHSKVLSFGLGENPGPVSATVHWPGGVAQKFDDLPAGHLVSIREGATGFEAKPFRAVASYAAGQVQAPREDLDAATETWLVEPIRPPGFSLPGASGQTLALASLTQPALLVFASSDCAGSVALLDALAKTAQEWKQQGLDVVAVVPAQDPTGAVARPFAVLLGDARTLGVYNLFYRYLYERRRDMPLPTAFLLNGKQEAIKVYTGGVPLPGVLKDHLAAPTDAGGYLARSLPFPGPYFGPGFHHNYFTYGVAFLQHEYTAEALAFFEQAIALNSSQSGAYYNAGIIYLSNNQFNEARTYLEKAVQLDPSDANAWNNLGVVAGQQEKYDEARTYFEKTLSLQPYHLLALQNLVKLYVYQNRPADAKRILEAAIASQPSDGQLHLEYAMFLFNQQQPGEAEGEFQRVVQLQPNNVQGWNGLGVLSMREGKDANAVASFEKCIRIDPEFDRPYLNLAAIYFKSGQRAQALELLSGYLRSHPDNQEIAEAVKQLGAAN